MRFSCFCEFELTFSGVIEFGNLCVFKGTIVGLFTIEDYSFYRLNKSSLNKRIITMTTERIQAQSNYFSDDSRK